MTDQDAKFRAHRRKLNEKAREEASPVQRARMAEAAKALRDGRIKVPMTCATCHSASLIRDDDASGWECLSCGRRTSNVLARQVRLQKMEKIIRDGIDVPGLLPDA